MPWKPYDLPEGEEPTVRPMAWTYTATTLAIWKTSGDNCDACQKLQNRVYPFAYWRATIMPGFHDHCDCRLVAAPAGAFESPHDLWGTDPIWWDPSLDVFTFLSNLFTKYIKWLQTRGQGDKYSGFDNLYPVFMSESGITTAQGTMNYGTKGLSPIFNMFREWLGLGEDKFIAKYKIRVNGFAFVSGGSGIIWRKLRDPEVCLPWENYPTAPTGEDYPDWY